MPKEKWMRKVKTITVFEKQYLKMFENNKTIKDELFIRVEKNDVMNMQHAKCEKEMKRTTAI